jgi:hypothetical protein
VTGALSAVHAEGAKEGVAVFDPYVGPSRQFTFSVRIVIQQSERYRYLSTITYDKLLPLASLNRMVCKTLASVALCHVSGKKREESANLKIQ